MAGLRSISQACYIGRASQIGVKGLLHKRPQVHHVGGHRWFLEFRLASQPDLTGESAMTDREAARSLQRYVGASGFATPSYTTVRGCDPGSACGEGNSTTKRGSEKYVKQRHLMRPSAAVSYWRRRTDDDT
jgi:hypothetical protein